MFRRRYIRFIAEGKDQPTLWQQLRGQIYLGDEPFVHAQQRHLGRDDHLKEIPRAQRRPEPKPIEHYARTVPDPKRAMAKAYQSGGYTLAEIASHFDVHYSTVSRAVGHRTGAHDQGA